MLACAGYVVTMLADCVISGHVGKGRGVRDVEGGSHRARVVAGSVAQDKDDDGLDSHATVRVGVPDQSAKSLLQNASSLGDSVLLIVALCFHSVFEGIAIGVAENRAESTLDREPAQNICSHRDGDSTAKNDPRTSPRIMCRLRLCLCHLQPHRGCHWDHYRRDDSGPCGGLDLRHLHGPRLWHLHLCLHKPSPVQRVPTSTADCCGLPDQQVVGCGVGGWGHCSCNDMGHMKGI
ncbi:zinc transporter 2-like [Iris pallida]|uniref:Zinc transporter 2-like n=1 Tax=Iris pallida TaxID=29817 RepID=A0AAX6DJI9_IRIPA|nr:zinc transporter 2-like [Iris pallida]